MTYEGDQILPEVEAEMAVRLERFNGLTKEEEVAMLSLTDAQRKLLSDNDRKIKNEFLLTAPPITHGSIKSHDKYKNYMKMVTEAA